MEQSNEIDSIIDQLRIDSVPEQPKLNKQVTILFNSNQK